MENAVSNRGGKRPGSGRHPVLDKKEQVYLMVRESRIKLIGEDRIKEICNKLIEEEYAKVSAIHKENKG